VNWETFPIWALREALEEPFRSVAENDIHALVAAQWIFHAGEVIYGLSVEESLVENPRITKGGSLFDGESGFNMKRWAFWKKRAGALSNEVSADVREIASAVVEKMSEIEGN
jgi:predicted NBD/HSP70 family sugar kinase